MYRNVVWQLIFPAIFTFIFERREEYVKLGAMLYAITEWMYSHEHQYVYP